VVSPAGASAVSAQTATEPSRVQLAFAGGSDGSWKASPDGWSRRIAHAFPFPPARCEVNSRWRPSGVKRGLLLSVLGLVNRVGVPPAVGTTQTSLCRRFSASRTVVTVKATRRPSGDTAGVPTVVIL
jgi:hypothetical protein